MERGKRMETPLPEAMIHQIQSFLTSKEAARTTLISKSWYNAWLTRPTLAFNQCDFRNFVRRSSSFNRRSSSFNRRSSSARFLKFVVETMQRYKDLNLKIESLQLQTQSILLINISHKLIVDAIKMGATNLNLEFWQSSFVLPPEVLQSETLLRLSLSGCEIDGNINCKMLKSLSLNNVLLRSDDMLRNILSCNWIEELSLSNSSNSKPRRLALSGKNLHLHELPKLKLLYLKMVDVDHSFFSDLESRFPCLKDLSLVHCRGYKRIRIISSSLQCITIVQHMALKAEFEVANLAVFRYSGYSRAGIPSICIIARDGWKSHISMKRHRFETSSWYLRLHALLTQLSHSRINLTISMNESQRCRKRIAEVDDDVVEVVGEPVPIENMRFEAKYDASHALVGLFCICRPKFLTRDWLGYEHSFRDLYEQVIGKVEVYNEKIAEWRPLLQDEVSASPKDREIRFHFKWY